MESKTFDSIHDFELHINELIGELRDTEIKEVLQKIDLYHAAKGFPEWISDELHAFNQQVQSMASPKKPLKASNTFKIQGGYPHEVEGVEKERLVSLGVGFDKNMKRFQSKIPKLDLQQFILLSNLENLISFSAPKDGRYVRDVVLVDRSSDEQFDIFYVVSRKARIISAWTVKRDEDGFKVELPSKRAWRYRQP